MHTSRKEDGRKRQSDEIELPIPPQKHELYRSPAPAGHERSRDDTRSTSMGQQPEIVLFRPSDSEREVDVQGQDRFPSWPSLQAEISREDYTHSLDFPGPDARLALPLQDSGLHQKVTYSLDLTFLRPDSPSLRIVALLPPFPYDDIGKFAEQFMTRHVQDTCPHELVDKELLFRTGTATIDTIGDKESYDLSMKSDWDLQLINKPNNIGPIHVEIHRDYIALRNCAETNKTFASTKRDEIASLKCKAANKLKYFPRIDIELIACRGTIEKVVAEDSTSAMNSAEKEEFANTIYQNAQILFASCVRAQLRMECLKLLLDRGWNDAKLRLTPLEEGHLCHKACASNFDNLLEWQKSFRVAEFLVVGEHQDLDTEQNDRYYMLFPYATCNLRHYMAKWEFGSLRRTSTLWLLAQLRGLADALRSIHNLSEESTKQSQSQLAVPIKASGWHHDLKPDNILFFSTQKSPRIDRNSGEGTFRIADFGSAKINTLRSKSVNTMSPNGTPTYEPPEQETEGSTSRPYDIWSMGCVFLELLVWALFDYDAVKKFSSQRLANCAPLDSMKCDAFWLVEKEGHAVKRRAVTDQVATLQAEIQKKHVPFDGVLRIVEDMLTIDSRKRVDAVRVWNRLDQIYKLADADFQDSREDVPEIPILRESNYPLFLQCKPAAQTFGTSYPENKAIYTIEVKDIGSQAQFIVGKRKPKVPHVLVKLLARAIALPCEHGTIKAQGDQIDELR
ncbi:MAG: hypothetical protein LQ343_005086 [Gyalolechia ehrenbergii]|nr:MAG: hypothetical protein LQ343_005086 [Gyalolechia ehrenbergii]